MNTLRAIKRLLPGAVLAAMCAAGFAQTVNEGAAPLAKTIITASPKRANAERQPDLTADKVTARSGRTQLQVESFTRLDSSSLQLLILIDDSAVRSFANQLTDIKKFLNELPPNVQVGAGYMQYGRAVLTTNGLTTDHAQVAQSLRIPGGSPGSSGGPYFVISDTVKHWPAKTPATRKILLVITDGVEGYSSILFDPQNPYFRAAIEDAQKAGVLVYSIFYADQGLLDRFAGIRDAGQNYLTGLSDETGGHFYYQGLGNPVSLDTFLADLQTKLTNQYEMSFRPRNVPKDGLVDLKVKIQAPGLDVEAPQRVYVPR